MSFDAYAHARTLARLLPPGAAWVADAGSRLAAFLLGAGAELARIDGRGDDLVRESDPRTTLELLEDWERVLGLPDECLLTIPDSISERRAMVTQKAWATGGQTPQYYVELAATLGYDARVSEFRPMRAGFHAGDTCGGDDWAFAWRVEIPIVGITAFGPGSHAGDRLRGWGSLDLECIIRRAAPAHTVVLFAYV